MKHPTTPCYLFESWWLLHSESVTLTVWDLPRYLEALRPGSSSAALRSLLGLLQPGP